MRPALAIVATAALAALGARMVWPWALVCWVMLVPWLRELDRTPSLSGTVAHGLAMAVAFTGAVFWWFPGAIADYAEAPTWLTTVILAGAAPLFQPQFVPFALARRAARRRGLGAARTAVVGATVYVGAEWAFPKLFGDTLGMGFLPFTWLRQAAAVGGLAGLTIAVVLGNECVRAMVDVVARSHGPLARGLAAPVMALCLIVVVPTAYGGWRAHRLSARSAEPSLHVGVVQANLGHYEAMADELGTHEAVRRILDRYLALSGTLAGASLDLLVWPETVYPTTFGTPKSPDGAAFDRTIADFVVARGHPLIFGSYDAEADREYNAAVVLAPDGRGRTTFETYRKASLFPLTERVPAWLDGPIVRRWLPWVGSWSPGESDPVVDVALAGGRHVRVGPLICYDAVDPRLARRAAMAGAQLLVMLSNDSWLADEGTRLHFVVSLFRGIETGLPLVRVTTTGITALTLPSGAVVRTLGVGEHGAFSTAVVPVTSAPPLAARWGDWVGPAGLVVAAVLLARPNARG